MSSTVLYKFQQKGVLFIERKNGRALIADEQGLGKTIQAISYLYRNPKVLPAIIVCPASLKENWRKELRKWARIKAVIVEGETPYELPADTKVIIINYEILQHWVDHLYENFRYRTLILDEGQFVKNEESIRSQAVDFLNEKRRCKHILILTGTPIENRTKDIWNLIRLIRPKLFKNFYHFAHKYCDAKRGSYGWNFDGSSNEDKLNKLLKNTIMLRRLKDDVLDDLPPKQISKVVLPINNRKEYQEAEKDFMGYVSKVVARDARKLNDIIDREVKNFTDKELAKKVKLSGEDIDRMINDRLDRISNAPALIQVEYLKQLAVEGKMPYVIDWIENFLKSGEKLVVFTTHKKAVKMLKEAFSKVCVVLDGDTPKKKRQPIVDKFQTDPKVRLFIGNIKAAGVGHTLTAASNAALIQFPWNPSDVSQAMDRIHRITQKKQVTIWNLVGVNTIEEKIIELLQEKQENIDRIIDGKKPAKTSSLVHDLIRSYVSKKQRKDLPPVPLTKVKRTRTKFKNSKHGKVRKLERRTNQKGKLW